MNYLPIDMFDMITKDFLTPRDTHNIRLVSRHFKFCDDKSPFRVHQLLKFLEMNSHLTGLAKIGLFARWGVAKIDMTSIFLHRPNWQRALAIQRKICELCLSNNDDGDYCRELHLFAHERCVSRACVDVSQIQHFCGKIECIFFQLDEILPSVVHNERQMVIYAPARYPSLGVRAKETYSAWTSEIHRFHATIKLGEKR